MDVGWKMVVYILKLISQDQGGMEGVRRVSIIFGNQTHRFILFNGLKPFSANPLVIEDKCQVKGIKRMRRVTQVVLHHRTMSWR
jgi:hypothetical protein